MKAPARSSRATAHRHRVAIETSAATKLGQLRQLLPNTHAPNGHSRSLAIRAHSAAYSAASFVNLPPAAPPGSSSTAQSCSSRCPCRASSCASGCLLNAGWRPPREPPSARLLCTTHESDLQASATSGLPIPHGAPLSHAHVSRRPPLRRPASPPPVPAAEASPSSSG